MITRFRVISNYIDKESGEIANNVNCRLEYFHHYWTFLFAKNRRYLLIAEEKFESHRSLLEKIKNQLFHNPDRYARQFHTSFVEHQYFSRRNIIIRNSPITFNHINNLQSYFTANFVNSNNGNVRNNESLCSQHIDHIKQNILTIERSILRGNYLKRILNYLIKELTKDIHLQVRSKNDIKFLINATIIELYYFGYSLEFIKRIPDIILFPSFKKYSFPFEKDESDFESKDAHERYIENELLGLDLNKQIISLNNLIHKPKLKGYYVFRIEGIKFENDEPLRIWRTLFYNPQKELKLNYSTFNNDYREYISNIEKYFSDKIDPAKEEHKSYCNAIIPITYRPLYWDHPDDSLIKAYSEVNESLKVFKYLYRGFVMSTSLRCEINPYTYIITDKDLKYRWAPSFRKDYIIPFKVKLDWQKKNFNEITKGINKLNPNNGFHRKIMRMYSNLHEIRQDPWSFNFKDYWTIFCESIFPNDPNGYISFCKLCNMNKIDKHYFTDAKIFLSDTLKHELNIDGIPSYSLKDKALKKLGLVIGCDKIKDTTFKIKYQNLKDYCKCEFINEIIEELTLVEYNSTSHKEIINKWISKTIWEVYSERNLETHNDISSDLSLIQLRESFIFIAQQVVLTLWQQCNSRTKNINDILSRLNT